PQSFNRYEYAMNNPLSNIDPSGLCEFDNWMYEADENGNGCVIMVPGGYADDSGGEGGGGGGGGSDYGTAPNQEWIRWPIGFICIWVEGVPSCYQVFGQYWVNTSSDIAAAFNSVRMAVNPGSGGSGGGGAPNKAEPV